MEKLKQIIRKRYIYFLGALILLCLLIVIFVLLTQKASKPITNSPVSNAISNTMSEDSASALSFTDEDLSEGRADKLQSIKSVFNLENYDWLESTWNTENDIPLDTIRNDKIVDENISPDKWTFVSDYYYALTEKDFETAQKFGLPGRTIEEYKYLYGDIEHIYSSFISYIGNNKVNAEVTIFPKKGSQIEYYEVELELDLDMQKIINATPKEIQQSYKLDCSATIYFCIVRKTSDNGIIRVQNYGIGQFPYIQLGKQAGENSIYLIAESGELWYQKFVVMTYDVQSKEIELADILNYQNIRALDNLPENCEPSMMESTEKELQMYEVGGCLYEGYQSAEWFQNNIKYLKNYSIYL